MIKSVKLKTDIQSRSINLNISLLRFMVNSTELNIYKTDHR